MEFKDALPTSNERHEMYLYSNDITLERICAKKFPIYLPVMADWR